MSNYIAFLIEVKSKRDPVTWQFDYLIQRHHSIVRTNHFISLYIKARSLWNEQEYFYASTEFPTHFKCSQWFRVTFVPENYHQKVKPEIY